MGDNQLELDVYLKLHIDEVSEQTFKGIEEAAKKTADNIEATFDMKKVANNIASISKGFSGITKVIGSIGGKLGAVGAVVTGIGAAVVASYKIWQKYLDVVTSVLNKIKDIETPIVKTFAKIESSIIKTVSKFNLLTLGLKGLKTLAGEVSSAFAQLVPDINFSDIIKESVELSSSLKEVQNVVDIVFKGGADEINKFAETAIEKMGMTTLSAKQFAGKFGAALQTTGQSAKSTMEMSKALTQLTADLASFYDIEQDIAAEKLFSGVISGQVRPMRELGVDMSKASLEAFAAAKGYDKLYANMSAAEKQAVRFNYAMEKLAFTAGDYERTINSTANQIRLLKNQFKELASVLGSIINAVFNPFIIALNQIMAGVIGVVKSIASALGVDWTMGAGGAASTVSGLADAYDDLADSEDDVADATDKAAKAAKKALAPFHKLNVLQNKDNASGSKKATPEIGGGAGLDAQKLEETGAKLPSIQKMFEKFLAWIHGLDTSKLLGDLIEAFNKFARGIPSALAELWAGTEPYIRKLAALFNQFVEETDWWAWGNAINSVFKFVGNIINTFLSNVHFGSIGVAFGNFVNGLFADLETFKIWGQNVGMAIQGVFDSILAAVNQIKWERIGTAVFTFVQEGFGKLSPARWYLAIRDGLNGLTTALNVFVSSILGDTTTINKIGQAIAAIPEAIASYLGGSGFSTLVKNTGTLVRTIFSALNQSFTEVDPATGLNSYESVAKGISEFLTEAINTITSDDFLRMVQGLVNSFIDSINEAFEGHPILKHEFLKMLGFNEIEWGTLGTAVDMWGESLNKVEKEAKEASDAVAMFAKYNKDAYDAMVEAGAGADEIEKAAEKWYKAQDSASKYQMTLDDIVTNSADKLNYLVVSINDVIDAFAKQGKSVDDVREAFQQAGISEEQYYQTAYGGSEALIKATDDQIAKLKEYDIMVDNNESGVRRMTEAELAGFNQMGISVRDYANNYLDAYDNGILPKLEEAKQATVGLSDEQVRAAAIAEKYGYDYEEVLAKISASSAQTVNDVRGDADAQKQIYDDLANEHTKTAEQRIQADKDIAEQQKLVAQGAREKTEEETGLLGTLWNDVTKAGEDAINRANTYVGDLYGSETRETVAANTQENIVTPITETIEQGLLDADTQNKIFEQIADPELRSKLETFLNENLTEGVKTSVEDVRTFLAEEGNILLDADGNLIGATPDSVQTAATQSLSGVNTAIEGKRTELATGDSNILTPDGTLIGTTKEDVKDTTDTVLTGVDDAVDSHTEEIQKKADAGIKLLEDAFTALVGWFDTDVFAVLDENVSKTLTTIQGYVDDLVENLKTGVGDAVDDILTKWEQLNKSVENWADSMSSALDKAADSASKLADKLKEAASAQKEYNSSKNSSSSNNRGYPSSVQGYANGGVFLPNRPQLAILGDNRSQTEYALTTGHLQQIADMMANTIGSITTGSDQPITIPIYLGNELIDKRVITAGQMHNYRSNGR